MSSPESLVDRYVTVRNEPDAERRHRAIASLWVEDGAHFTPSLEARGYEALEARITSAHDRFVRGQGYVFSSRNVTGHHGTVKFNWEMRPATGGPIAAYGFDFFVLGEDGRIRCDYQFPEPTPPA
jgi:hypothetical protein